MKKYDREEKIQSAKAAKARYDIESEGSSMSIEASKI